MSRRLCLTLALTLVGALAVGCGPSIPKYDYGKEPNPYKSEYVIGVSDQLSINVWKNAELSTNVGVRPDGTITLPLLGDITASRRTPTQLRKEIQKRLGRYVKDETAIVTVSVTAVNSYRFTVSGEVQNPGVFNTSYYVSVVEAVAMAGGFTRFAKRDKLLIMRRDGKGDVRQIPVSFDAIATGDHEYMNIALMSGDTLIIP